MSVKKFRLDMSYEQEAFFAETALVGLSCRMSATSLCRLLNLSFGLSFTRNPEIDKAIERPNAETYYFPGYDYRLPLCGDRYLLYRLRSRGECMFPELRQLDFIWLLQSSNASAIAQGMVKHLRELREIQLAQIIDANMLKDRNTLLL